DCCGGVNGPFAGALATRVGQVAHRPGDERPRIDYHRWPANRGSSARVDCAPPAGARLMDATAKERLWGYRHALDTQFVQGFLLGLLALLIVVPLCLWLLQLTRRIDLA